MVAKYRAVVAEVGKARENQKIRRKQKRDRILKNFLAVDTSSEYLTVIAVKDGNPTISHLPDCAMKHSVALLNEIDRVLDKSGMTLADCDFFSAVVGAGSFTGIRIGISAMKGFCLALQKPALPVTSFDVVAYNSVETGKRLCLVNAMHDAYYACGYEGESVVYPPCYLTEEEVLALQKQGYALVSASELPISAKAEVQVVDGKTGLLNAVNVLSEQGKFGELVALYARKSSAELNLKA